VTSDLGGGRGAGAAGRVVEQADPGHRKINHKGEDSKTDGFLPTLLKDRPSSPVRRASPSPLLQFSCSLLAGFRCEQVVLI